MHHRGPGDDDRLRPWHGRGGAPIREQGIYKRDVNIGHNVWIGYGACVLRGVTVGDNSVIGTSAVVTCDVADNAMVGVASRRLIRKRDAPRTFRWE